MIELQTIGVIGAGQMGNGIAHVSALAGYDVVMTDISEDALKHGMESIEKNMVRQVAREQFSMDEMKAALARIKTSTSIKSHENDDLVIEAATEKREVKEQIFRSICEIVPPRTYLATNTSSISITRLASVTDRSPRRSSACTS
jgi:3-hydroxybutyryl-CoA dehydrogenase